MLSFSKEENMSLNQMSLVWLYTIGSAVAKSITRVNFSFPLCVFGSVYHSDSNFLLAPNV